MPESQDAKVLTVYVCPNCGKVTGKKRVACCVKERRDSGLIVRHMTEPVEVVPRETAEEVAEQLRVERAHRVFLCDHEGRRDAREYQRERIAAIDDALHSFRQSVPERGGEKALTRRVPSSDAQLADAPEGSA